MLALVASELSAASAAASSTRRRLKKPRALAAALMPSSTLTLSRPDRALTLRSTPSLALRALDDGGSAAAIASPSEEEEEEEEEEAAPSLSPLVVVPPSPPQTSSSSSGTKRLGFFVASAALAHPDKAQYGGEDAWFCSPSSGTIGIADGVGGWAESGVCPAEYARELMAATRSAAEGVPPRKVTVESLAAARGGARSGSESASPPSPSPSSSASAGAEQPGVPLSCFEAAGGGAPAPVSASASAPASASAASPSAAAAEGEAYSEDGGASPLESLLAPSPPPPSEIPTAALAAAHAAVRLPGSATACVVTLDPESGTLHGVSVGDSSALVVRKNFLLFRSSPTSHSFDCPRQLAAAPEFVEWTDGVENGEAFEVEGLEEGDLVLLGTDGVFDNLWPEELLALLPAETAKVNDEETPSPSPSSSSLTSSARELAEKIVRLAAANSRDESYPSPYAAEAAACGVDLRGGGNEEETNSFGAVVSSFASRLFGGNSDDEDEGSAAILGGKVDDITVVVARVGAVSGGE